MSETQQEVLDKLQKLFPYFEQFNLGFHNERPFVEDFYGKHLDRGNIAAAIKFLELYLEVCPEQQDIDHMNGYRCAVANCDECRVRENQMNADLCFPLRDRPHQVLRGTVFILEAGSKYKIACSKSVEKRAKEISRECGLDVRIVHEIETSDMYALKWFWLRKFVEYVGAGCWFELPAGAINNFSNHQTMEVAR